MLMRLLSLVEEDGLHSYTTLSDQLCVSTSLLEYMLQDLARMGYIAPVGGDCDMSQCHHCPLGGSCATDSRGNVWVITKKGMQATENKQYGTGPSFN